MKVQQKGTPRGQNKSLGRGKSFSSKVSTARLGKTQAVNSFLVDPVSFATHQPDDDLDSDEEPDVEPWLEEFEANEPSLRQERAIRS